MDSIFVIGPTWYVIFVFSMLLYRAGGTMARRLEGKYEPCDFDPVKLVRSQPVGMLLVPILTFLLGHFMCGWCCNIFDCELCYTDPRRASRRALAGPLVMFSLAIWAMVLMRIGLATGILTPAFGFFPTGGANLGAQFIALVLGLVFINNLFLGTFYMLPIPPLDGYQAIGLLMPEGTARRWQSKVLPIQYQFACILLAMLVFNLVAGYVLHVALYLGGFSG